MLHLCFFFVSSFWLKSNLGLIRFSVCFVRVPTMSSSRSSSRRRGLPAEKTEADFGEESQPGSKEAEEDASKKNEKEEVKNEGESEEAPGVVTCRIKGSFSKKGKVKKVVLSIGKDNKVTGYGFIQPEGERTLVKDIFFHVACFSCCG